MKENLPEIKKEGIFTKIKKRIKNLLGVGEIEEYIEKEHIINNAEIDRRSDFKKSIQVESNDRILALKRKLEEQQIKIEDLTDNELDRLIEIYKEQIILKENKIKSIKKKTGIYTKEG